jgi:hypothetical protein
MQKFFIRAGLFAISLNIAPAMSLAQPAAPIVDEAYIEKFVQGFFASMRIVCAVAPVEDQMAMEWGLEDHYVRIGLLLKKLKLDKVLDEANARAEAEVLRKRQSVKCVRPDAKPIAERRKINDAIFARAEALLRQTEQDIRAQLKEK